MKSTHGVRQPSGAELRQKARELLGLISQTDDHQVRRDLARRAFELVREAEELRPSEETESLRDHPRTPIRRQGGRIAA